jgi:hypothetical protein
VARQFGFDLAVGSGWRGVEAGRGDRDVVMVLRNTPTAAPGSGTATAHHIERPPRLKVILTARQRW